jgi:hypothetical protein
VIDKVSISPAVSIGELWDSIEEPADVPATGPAGVTLSANTATTLDPVDYILTPTKDLIIAFDINSAGGGARKADLPGFSFFFRANTDEAAKRNRSSGYQTMANTVFLVEKIEVL